MKDYSEYKKIMKLLGIIMIIIGIILIILGWGVSGLMYIGGGFIAMIGFVLLRTAFIRPVSKYYATEMSPAIEIAGGSIGKGLKESGLGNSQTKEVIKIKCPHCRYLESEDADFCSKCGKKI